MTVITAKEIEQETGPSKNCHIVCNADSTNYPIHKIPHCLTTFLGTQ